MVLLILPVADLAAESSKTKPVSITANTDNRKEGIEVSADQSTGEQVNWQVISSGGDIGGTSTNFGLSGTAGQTAVGAGSSTNFGLSHGFWQESGGDVCDCVPGDANNDGSVNVGDAVYVIAYVFSGGAPPSPYAICSGDANCDCQCNVGDAVFIISYVFKGGPAPCSCEEWLSACGPPLRE
jgi:hypothetical protein